MVTDLADSEVAVPLPHDVYFNEAVEVAGPIEAPRLPGWYDFEILTVIEGAGMTPSIDHWHPIVRRVVRVLPHGA